MAKKTDPLDPNVVELLLKTTKNPQDLFSEGGVFQQLKAALCQRILDGELTAHLGYDKHDASGDKSGNSRNGYRDKHLRSKEGPLSIKMPQHTGYAGAVERTLRR